MTPGPILSLRAAILALAQGDAALLALMGGTLRLYDEPPRAAEPVYAVFGEARVKDWSSDLDRGDEQEMEIVVWAREGSARTGLLTADRLAAILHEADPALDGHRLVNLRLIATHAAKDEEARLTRISLRFRAVTETL